MELASPTFANEPTATPEVQVMKIPKKRKSEKQTSGPSKKAKKKKEAITEKENKEEENREEIIRTPEYIPTEAEETSSPELSPPETPVDTPIQSHTNIDLIAFDTLDSSNVTKLRQERDRLEFGGLRKRHTLLHQLDRSVWPALFVILQLRGKIPSRYSFEAPKHFNRFRLCLYTEEDEVLRILETQFPTQKATSIVELCSKIVWRIDPRYPTYLSQYGKAKQRGASGEHRYHPRKIKKA